MHPVAPATSRSGRSCQDGPISRRRDPQHVTEAADGVDQPRFPLVDLATALIMISTHEDEDYAELIAESPAAGFLSKAELSATAIHRILGTA